MKELHVEHRYVVCRYCGKKVAAGKVEQHLDDHLEVWRNAPREKGK